MVASHIIQRGRSHMNRISAVEKDKKMAQHCVECPVCARARKKQRGIAYWFVKYIEKGICPYCAAYERVYGKKAHEA
jgi:hypothetical protein